MTLDELYTIINDRKQNPKDSSYVVGLLGEGLDRIAQKVGEEAVETVIAAKGDNKERLISEMADLWFHCLILLAASDITPGQVMAELESRRK